MTTIHLSKIAEQLNAELQGEDAVMTGLSLIHI